MRDFYSLFAFSKHRRSGPEPVTPVFVITRRRRRSCSLTPQQTRALRNWSRQIAPKKAGRPLRDPLGGAFLEWLKSKPVEPTVPGLQPPFRLMPIEDYRIANSADSSKPGKRARGPALVEGKYESGETRRGEWVVRFPAIGHFYTNRSQNNSHRAVVADTLSTARQVVLTTPKRRPTRGVAATNCCSKKGTLPRAASYVAGQSLKGAPELFSRTNEWVHVAFTYEGSSRAAACVFSSIGAPAPSEVIPRQTAQGHHYPGGEPELAIGTGFRDAGFNGGKVDDFAVFQSLPDR